MNSKLRATMALALSLIGVSSVVASAPAPEEKDTKPPVFNKRPGQEAPEKVTVKGGGPTNSNEDGPACPGGPMYRRVVDPDSGVPGWRAFQFSLYYKASNGEIHAYQPGQDPARDKAFPSMARKMGLVLLNRAARRELHREERARYKAIQKARVA